MSIYPSYLKYCPFLPTSKAELYLRSPDRGFLVNVYLKLELLEATLDFAAAKASQPEMPKDAPCKNLDFQF